MFGISKVLSPLKPWMGSKARPDSRKHYQQFEEQDCQHPFSQLDVWTVSYHRKHLTHEFRPVGVISTHCVPNCIVSEVVINLLLLLP